MDSSSRLDREAGCGCEFFRDCDAWLLPPPVLRFLDRAAAETLFDFFRLWEAGAVKNDMVGTCEYVGCWRCRDACVENGGTNKSKRIFGSVCLCKFQTPAGRSQAAVTKNRSSVGVLLRYQFTRAVSIDILTRQGTDEEKPKLLILGNF